MTTLFPQIKRVSEDETSKIIKNVLFSDQDESRLEQIFEEFTHLTKETITFSDVEFSIEDDEDDEDDDEDNDDEDNEEEDDDDDEEDDDDDDDDEDDEDDDDDSGSSSDSDDEEEPGTARSPSPIQPQASREPTSWNLDQFIPVTSTKQSPTPPKQSPTPPKLSPTPPKRSLTPPKRSPTPPQRSPTPPKQSPPPPPPIKLEPTPVKHSARPTKRSPARTKRSPTPTKAATTIVDAVISDAKPQPPQSQQPESPKTQKTSSNSNSASSSCIVQIDLSKLKRIPATKAPTPTTSVSSNSLLTAKALKHEADGEKDRTKQTIKYLESAMYFVLHGYELEVANNTNAYYYETMPLFKYVIRLSAPENVKNPDNMTHVKIHALALRCLSLLHFRLYKLQERALQEAAKTIQQHSQNSPIQQVDGMLVGIRPQLHSAYKKQIAIFNELKNAHDRWHNVELLCDLHPALRIFFSTIESNCGPLTMVSPFSKLMEHIKCGLKLLRTS